MVGAGTAGSYSEGYYRTIHEGTSSRVIYSSTANDPTDWYSGTPYYTATGFVEFPVEDEKPRKRPWAPLPGAFVRALAHQPTPAPPAVRPWPRTLLRQP
jgi:hypothetical protein